MARTTSISPNAIRALIAAGHLIVISEQRVLQLDAWVAIHPGGRLPILHMVGKDATDQINVYHSAATLKSISRYQIGTILEPWIDMEPPISTEPLNESNALDSASVLANESDKSLTGSKIYDGTTTAAFMHMSENEEIDRAIRDYPSLDPETQHEINLKFRKLHNKVKEQGLYDCNYWNYGFDFCRYMLLLGFFCFFFTNEQYLVSACFLGCFWQQIMFVAHDAGHLGITHNRVFDTLLAILIADLCCGLSIGWWKSSHDVHHLVPNHPKHDPDIQNVPILATSPTFFTSVHSTYYESIFPWDRSASFFVRLQKYSYYPIMFVARFNLYFLSWQHVLFSFPLFNSRKRQSTPPSRFWVLYLELACMSVYWLIQVNLLLTIPNWPSRILFVFISHGITMLLHIQITISHFGMSTADLGPTESFAQKQLRTTMDVDCPPWLDWIHGGLQFQAIHHLFPRMPKHNYRKAQKLVKEFSRDTGIKYTIFGFVEGNKVVLGRLEEISKQVSMLMKCQEYMAICEGLDMFETINHSLLK